MSIQVSTFNQEELQAEIAKAAPIIRDYIKALKNVNKANQNTINSAIKKIRELSIMMNNLK